MGKYRGESLSKAVVRRFVWWQHERLIGSLAFGSGPHVFLASREAGDIDVIRAMGVPYDRIWAVEREREEYEELFARQEREKFRLLTRNIEHVIENPTMVDLKVVGLRSVYLDFCGNIEGSEKTCQQVVSKLLHGSSLTITLSCGRERRGAPKSRAKTLLKNLQKHTEHKITLVQEISYYSSEEKQVGSQMITCTFALGALPSRGKMKFNFRDFHSKDLSQLSIEDIRAIWQIESNRTLRQSLAAQQANIARTKASA